MIYKFETEEKDEAMLAINAAEAWDHLVAISEAIRSHFKHGHHTNDRRVLEDIFVDVQDTLTKVGYYD